MATPRNEKLNDQILEKIRQIQQGFHDTRRNPSLPTDEGPNAEGPILVSPEYQETGRHIIMAAEFPMGILARYERDIAVKVGR